MPEPSLPPPSSKSMLLLSHLLLSGPLSRFGSGEMTSLLDAELLRLDRTTFDQLAALASSNHVLVRGMEIFRAMMLDAGDGVRAAWAERALATERARIATAVLFVASICAAFAEERQGLAVIKSLDHWPDLGSDLDLYTSASPAAVLDLMERRFAAAFEHRSWGDRLANKWNFRITGLPEAVEIHVGRLGQTGEQTALASSLLARTRQLRIAGLAFRVPAVSDRIMISVLQRMYRHFYFRLCDIVDSAGLVERDEIDYDDLERCARSAGIWPGVATYLVIVCDYVKQHGGPALALPEAVTRAARFGGRHIYYAREFLRVPILPQSARLYGSQLGGVLRRRELLSSARLGLLPWLATAAAIGYKLTGSDKGIW